MWTNVKCLQCKQVFGADCYIESLQLATNGMIQVRGECPYCRSWLKWIPYKDSRYVKDILKYFYHGDLKALERLRKIAILNYKKEEIQ